jgi:hypothetical protein
MAFFFSFMERLQGRDVEQALGYKFPVREERAQDGGNDSAGIDSPPMSDLITMKNQIGLPVNRNFDG